MLSSCATLLTRNSYNVDINSNAKSAKVKISDSIHNLPATVEVNRSKKDLEIILITDTAELNYTVEPALTPTFLFANLLWFPLSPVAYLVDLTNERRFYYGQSVFFDINDSIRIIKPPILNFFQDFFAISSSPVKGELYLHLSLPHVNFFRLNPINEGVKTNAGFWGISLGLDYYHSKSQFVNLGFSGVTDLFVPVPVSINVIGEWEIMSSRYISLSNNHRIGRFSFGYGVSFARNAWQLRYYEDDYDGDAFRPPPPTRDPVYLRHYTLGLIFPLYYHVRRNFSLGVIYRPTFLIPGSSALFNPEHLISIDLAWKIRLKRQ